MAGIPADEVSFARAEPELASRVGDLRRSSLLTFRPRSRATSRRNPLGVSVQGAVYGIVMAKISEHTNDDPYGWESYAILLPWVSHGTGLKRKRKVLGLGNSRVAMRRGTRGNDCPSVCDAPLWPDGFKGEGGAIILGRGR